LRLHTGANLAGSPWLQSAPMTCEALAAGVGAAGLDCAEASGGASVTLAGPIFVASSGAALPLGSVKYVGAVLAEFLDAVRGPFSTRGRARCMRGCSVTSVAFY
jgi:hypothetical protein